MTHTVEVFGSSIVLVGSFNPAIFSPHWLQKNQLIGSEDLDAALSAENMVVSRQLALFATDWFQLQVLENQFSLTSKGALSPAFQDLAEGMLSLVPHTPVGALGLNFLAHYKMAAESEYHKVGDALVPKKIWNEVFEPMTPGTAEVSVKIQRAKRGETATTPDEIRIQIQPSARIKFGVFMSYNDHREAFATKASGRGNAAGAVEIIESDWEATWHRAETVFDEILVRASAGSVS